MAKELYKFYFKQATDFIEQQKSLEIAKKALQKAG